MKVSHFSSHHISIPLFNILLIIIRKTSVKFLASRQWNHLLEKNSADTRVLPRGPKNGFFCTLVCAGIFNFTQGKNLSPKDLLVQWVGWRISMSMRGFIYHLHSLSPLQDNKPLWMYLIRNIKKIKQRMDHTHYTRDIYANCLLSLISD